MKIIDYPSPNFFLAGNPIKAICLHGTAGPLQASLDILTRARPDRPELAVSSHYLIDINGDIYRLLKWWKNQRSFANGIVKLPDKNIGWLIAAVAAGINPNLITISIEHVASSTQMKNHSSMTDAQFNSSIALVTQLLKDCKLPISNQTIIGHNQINSIDKVYCPGVIDIPAYIEVLTLRS